MISTQSPLARKLGNFVALSEAELAVLDTLHRRRRSFAAGRDIVFEGQTHQAAYILAEGWVCSYKLMRNGSRQIVDFQIPGDFLGLRSVLFRTADHNPDDLYRRRRAPIPAGRGGRSRIVRNRGGGCRDRLCLATLEVKHVQHFFSPGVAREPVSWPPWIAS